jgi:integrase
MPKKPKTPAGEPAVKVNHGRLQIIVNYCGDRKTHSVGLPESKQNRVYAESVSSWMRSDLLNNNFDPTFDKYKRDALKPDEHKPDDDISIAQLWEQYTNYKRPQLSQTTIAKDFDRIRCNIAKLPTTKISDAVAIRDYLIKHTTPNTAKRVLSKLSAACNWGVVSNLLASNPFVGMSADIKTGKKSDEGDITPFTSEERDLIIERFKTDGSHYAPLVEFLFRTGCRPSEAIAIQAKHVSKDYRSITFCQSVTASESGLKLKQGLKTQSQRVFPCGEGLSLFLKSLVVDGNPESFLFKPISTNSKFINIDKFSYREWHKVLKSLGIADTGIYQCRHTYITFCLDSGMDAKDVAKLVGNSPEMIYRHYAGAKRDLIAPDL